MIGTINIQVGGDSNSLDVFNEEVADIVISTAGFAQIAAANGYVKLEPGQCVVDKRLHELALSMAAKWERHLDALDAAKGE